MSQPTHTRIRMFNTKDTYPNQTLDNDLCQAVRAGNTVYVRGQVGTDFEGRLIGIVSRADLLRALDAAQRARLNISATLLSVAKTVIDTAGGK